MPSFPTVDRPAGARVSSPGFQPRAMPIAGGLWLILAATAGAQPPPLAPPPAPPGNPVTQAKADLGKALFWDEQLSSTRTVACGTCHIAGAGGSDPRSADPARSTHPGADGVFGTGDDVGGSRGVPRHFSDGTYESTPDFRMGEQVTPRKANSAINAAYPDLLFWDGRAEPVFRDPATGDVVLAAGAALESQVLGPPVNDVEMGHVDRDWADAAQTIASALPLALASEIPEPLAAWIAGRDYPALFEEAFGTPEVTPVRIAMAIATYERTLFSDQTPLDDFLGGNPGALTIQENQGRIKFLASSCSQCHGTSLLSDGSFRYIGVRPAGEDAGRFAVTGDPDDLGRFRVPGLRNVALRAPFFHNGRFETLMEVVDFYNRGGDFDAPNKDFRIQPLGLGLAEKEALVAFLSRPLIDPRVAAGEPPFDRPVLFSESGCVPSVSGTGVTGSGGFEPAMIALEPPLLGNPSFTVGIDGALGGADAVLAIDAVDPGTGPGIPTAASFALVPLSLTGSGNGDGSGSVSLTIPDDPALLGTALYGRWFVEDPAAPGGVAVSRRLRITPFTSAASCASSLFGDSFESGDASAWSQTISDP